MLEIIQIPVLKDNYIYLLRDSQSGETAIVDPAVDQPVIDILEAKGWKLDYILNTHHHRDHTGANIKLKDRYGLTIIGPAGERDKIPGIDIAVGEGDEIAVGGSIARVFDVPGHTAGHIAFHFAQKGALFCGDTLFSMGCGRLFEGTPDQMWQSLSKLIALPDETAIYCAHEYTAENGRFALTIDPDNTALKQRMADVKLLRDQNQPSIPTLLKLEKATNPFLRPMEESLQQNLGLLGAPLPKVFAQIRALKDNF